MKLLFPFSLALFLVACAPPKPGTDAHQRQLAKEARENFYVMQAQHRKVHPELRTVREEAPAKVRLKPFASEPAPSKRSYLGSLFGPAKPASETVTEVPPAPKRVAVVKPTPAPKPVKLTAFVKPTPTPKSRKPIAFPKPTPTPKPVKLTVFAKPTPTPRPRKPIAAVKPTPAPQPPKRVAAVKVKPAPTPKPAKIATAPKPAPKTRKPAESINPFARYERNRRGDETIYYSDVRRSAEPDSPRYQAYKAKYARSLAKRPEDLTPEEREWVRRHYRD